VANLRLEDSWMSSRNNGKEMIVSGRIGKEIRYQLFLVDVKTGAFRQITTDTAAVYSDPCFSPDGKQVVYRYKKSRRDRNEKAELWLMNADGKGLPRQLTHYPPTDTTAQWHDYHAGPPHWNAQAGYITYQSLQEGKYSIYAVTLDGKRQFKLVDMLLEAGWHAWGPDGDWLVMDVFNHDPTTFDIWLWNRKTKVLKQLTDTEKFEQSPVFVEGRK
jgi:TolB protein